MLLLTASSGHTGTVHHRYHPELSDLAVFLIAVLAIWFVRRALRRRFDRDKRTPPKD